MASLVLASGACLAHATDYPDRPVTVILPFPPGTVTDTVTRIVTEYLTQRLGQPFVVENRPGGSGSIGASQAARAAPDGYTILFTTNTTHSIIGSLLNKVPYDPQKDFTPVVKLADLPSMVIVGPSLPVDSLLELVQRARSNPGKVSYGFGNSSGQIGGEALRRAVGGEMIPVPYKGNPQGVQDLLGGHIDAMVVDITTGLGAVESGKVRALAVLTEKRMAILPDVPTMNEVLGPGNDNMGWFGVFGPVHMPGEVVDTLAREMKTVLNDSTVDARLKSLGVIPGYLPPATFVPFLAREQILWTKLARDAGIAPH
nr:tripartite tricarboxylate transporter substrate binding protein [Bordetella sp. BOR01]